MPTKNGEVVKGEKIAYSYGDRIWTEVEKDFWMSGEVVKKTTNKVDDMEQFMDEIEPTRLIKLTKNPLKKSQNGEETTAMWFVEEDTRIAQVNSLGGLMFKLKLLSLMIDDTLKNVWGWTKCKLSSPFDDDDTDVFDMSSLFEKECSVKTKVEGNHKLLFFGPSHPGIELAEEMIKKGVAPENKMDSIINKMMKDGWKVVYRHYDPMCIVEQWRVILER